MPEWYAFYDNRMGTTSLLSLPDVRGDKEEAYLKVAREQARALRQVVAPVAPPAPYRSSYCPANAEMCYAFALRFDDEQFAAIFKHMMEEEQRKEAQGEGYDVEDYIDTLEDTEISPIVTGGVNWREALKRTAQQYKNSIIADDLELLLGEQSLLQALAIQPDRTELQARYDEDGLLTMIRDQILDGREAVGEPRDFDF